MLEMPSFPIFEALPMKRSRKESVGGFPLLIQIIITLVNTQERLFNLFCLLIIHSINLIE